MFKQANSLVVNCAFLDFLFWLTLFWLTWVQFLIMPTFFLKHKITKNAYFIEKSFEHYKILSNQLPLALLFFYIAYKLFN